MRPSFRTFRESAAARVLVGLLFPAAVLGVKLPFEQFFDRVAAPFVLFPAAVAAATLGGGVLAGVVATAATGLAATYFFIEPYYSFKVSSFAVALIGLHVVECALIIYVIRLLQFSQARLSQLAEDLRAGEERHRSLVEATTSVVWLADSEGRFVRPQESWSAYTGQAWPGHRDWGWAEMLHPDDRPEIEKEWRDARATRSTYTAEGRIWNIDTRSYRHFVLRAVPVMDPADAVREWIGTITDVHELKTSEDALKRSEELLRYVRDATNDAVWDWNVATGTVTRGESFETLFGYKAGSMLHGIEWWREHIHADDRERVGGSLDAAVAASTHWSAEYRFMRADGSFAYVLDRALVIRRIGMAIRVVGAMVDITERHAEEERLKFIASANDLFATTRESEKVLSAITALAVPAIADWCAVDLAEGDRYRRLAVAHCDPQKVRLAWDLDQHHRPPQEKDPILQVIRSGEPQLVSSITDDLLQNSTDGEEHYEVIKSLGLRSWIIAPLCDGDRCIGAITFVTSDESGRRYSEADLIRIGDLTVRAALAVENARLYDELRHANEAKDQFFAALSHELRTPMTSIRGWVKMLQEGDLDAETAEEALAAIDSSSSLQAQLVDDLLDVARIAAGKLHLERQPVEIGDVVRSAAAQFRPLAAANGVVIVQGLRAEATVSGDKNRLKQVVGNLLSNAVKFTPRGGQVVIDLSRDDRGVTICVSDTGRGIAREFLPHIFDLYEQAAGGEALGGLGLGLAITHRLIALHGGTITAASEGEGKGASFTVRLPVADPV